MKRIDALMVISVSALLLSLLSLSLSLTLNLNLFRKLNKFMGSQININESTINQIQEIQDFENKLMNVIKDYEGDDYN